MGQKVNPTSLRLHSENKHFDSCWFSEKQYANSIHKNFNVEIYYDAILKQIQYPSASFFLEASPRKSRISVLFLNPAQLREQAFKQFGKRPAPSGKKRGIKPNAWFSTKKRTTTLCGLPEKESLSFELLPSYLFPPFFLQNLKNRGGGRSSPLNKENNNNLVWSSFLQVKRGDLPGEHVSSANENRLLQKIDRVSSLDKTKPILTPQLSSQFISFPERKNRMPFFFSQKKRRVDIASSQDSEKEGLGEQINFQSKKIVSFSLLGLAISRYFVQRNLSGNLLSTTSRFLLLQAFLSFVNVQEKSRVLSKKKTHDSIGVNDSHTSRLESGLFSNLQKSSSYSYHTESIISNRLKSSCKTFFFRAQNVAQNALFIAEEIVYQLQRRNSFRQIKTKFLQELGKKAPIKGVRVTCVGRIGGRAKKAQRARGESFKMGQTSLHLFDSKVSFASKTGLTPFGAVGVKVWVCWK